MQIKRYSAPLSDASVREFCAKIGTKAKRGIFIAPTGFGPGAREFAVRPKACAPLPLSCCADVTLKACAPLPLVAPM